MCVYVAQFDTTPCDDDEETIQNRFAPIDQLVKAEKLLIHIPFSVFLKYKKTASYLLFSGMLRSFFPV